MTETINKLTIRPATTDDVDTLVTFNQSMALETENKQLDVDVLTAGVTRLIANEQLGFYLVADVNGRVAGALMVTQEWSDWRNGVLWWIQSVYVAPEFRRQGIYRRLYAQLRELAKQDNDVCGFRLYVEQDNNVAQATYKSMGMAETHYRIFEQTQIEK